MDVDGVNAVLAAIAAAAGAGAGDAVKDMTKGAISGTKDRLLALLRGRLKNDPVGDAKLTVYSAEPSPANGQALQGHLVDAGVDQDQEILTLAREVLAATGPAALAPGSVAANVISQLNKDGGIGFIGGQHVHNHQASHLANRVCWDLLRRASGKYELRNTGTAAASDVDISANVELGWPAQPEREISAGSSVMLVCEPSLADESPVLTVSYSVDGSSERKTWRRPLTA